MILVYGRDADIAKWVASKTGLEFATALTAIGVIENEELCGGIVFHDYNGTNIEISIYGPGCMQRAVIRAAFLYVFEQLKCLRLTARTRRSNRLMCKLLPRLGFDYEATLKHYFGPARSDDALVFRLTEDYASRWM